MEQLELSHCRLECIMIQTLWQSVWQFKYPATLWYRSWIPRCSSKRHENMSAWYKNVHSSFIIREWINKSWYIHTMEWLSNKKGQTTDIHDMTDLKTTVLGYRSHTYTNTYCMSPLIHSMKIGKTSVMMKSDQLPKRVGRLLWIDWKGVHKGVFWGDGNVCCLVLVVVYVGMYI